MSPSKIFPALAMVAASASAFPEFIPHHLDDTTFFETPFRETLSPADLDGDGDPDFFSGQGRGGKEFWFENRGAGRFHAHLVSDSSDTDVGAAIADLDGDGDMDRLSGGFAYINPGNPRDRAFRTVRTGAPEFTHDLLAGDIDRDGRADFVIIDYPGIRWYRNAGPPFSSWPETEVSGHTTPQQHGGIALGDFDQDGDLDISRIDRWYENQDSGRTWILRPGPEFGVDYPSYYGLSARALAYDMDKDGDLDLVQAECDFPNARVAWFENREKGGAWIRHMVKDSTDWQDFHSLILADFDGDGDDDIFSAAGPTNLGPKHWYVWENLDGRGGAFREHGIWRDASRSGHESVAMDVDGDGDIDILSKEFGGYHTWLENRRITTALARTSGNRASPATRGFLRSRTAVWGLPIPLPLPGAEAGWADALGRAVPRRGGPIQKHKNH